MNEKFYLRTLAISGMLAVLLGAFGAHALKASLTQAGQMETFKTASFYHFVHSCILITLFALIKIDDHRVWRQSFILILTGMLLFAGSLYILSTRHLIGGDIWEVVGPVTPIGGLMLIAGWINLIRR